MVMPTPPLVFACSDCRWKQTFPFQGSDCKILGLDYFVHCPRCGGAVLARRANPMEVLAAKLAQAFVGPGRKF
jgi:hypothetical protein